LKKKRTDFAANWHKWSTGQGDKMFNFWGQEVKGRSRSHNAEVSLETQRV